MAEQFPELSNKLMDFINQQHIFFVGTAAPTGRVNISPKGMDTLRIINANQLQWLNLSGSGNETAAHTKQINRITLMWCSFDKQPLILRIYGSISVLHKYDEGWDETLQHFSQFPATRQVYTVNIEMVQTSCGFGVPHFDFIDQRDTLVNLWEKRDNELIKYKWGLNRTSIDGFETGIKIPD